MKVNQGFSMGYLFDDKAERIVMIQKIRPNWQAGYWSVPGGHIEAGEEALDCVVREFEEEAWLRIPPNSWKTFAVLWRPQPLADGLVMVHCFRAFTRHLDLVKTMTDETVRIFDVARLSESAPLLNSIQWLVPLALDLDPSLNPIMVPYTGLPLDQKEFRLGQR